LKNERNPFAYSWLGPCSIIKGDRPPKQGEGIPFILQELKEASSPPADV